MEDRGERGPCDRSFSADDPSADEPSSICGTRKNKQGAEAPCHARQERFLVKRHDPQAAADLSKLGEAELHHNFFGLGDFHFNDLLLHRIPPAPFATSFDLPLKPPAFLPISELREL
jgi:hypothetical protein